MEPAQRPLDRHRQHLLATFQQSATWEDLEVDHKSDRAVATEAVIRIFAELRDIHASQLVEPVVFTADEKQVLAGLVDRETPAQFADALLADESLACLLDRLCGIAPDGKVTP